MSSVLDLINAIEAGNTRECESTFEALIHAKIAEKMEERRAEIGDNMFESESANHDAYYAKMKADQEARRATPEYYRHHMEIKPERHAGLKVNHPTHGEGRYIDDVSHYSKPHIVKKFVKFDNGKSLKMSHKDLNAIADIDQHKHLEKRGKEASSIGADKENAQFRSNTKSYHELAAKHLLHRADTFASIGHHDNVASMRKVAAEHLEASKTATDKVHESEQLDELSKDTLGAYVKKASKERGYSGLEAGGAGAGSKEQKDAVNTMKKRQAGVVKAVDRLTKESEELDESCDVKLVDSDEDLDQQIYHFNVDGKKVTFTYWDYDEEFLPDTHEITSQVKKQLGKLTSAQQSAVVKAVIDDLKKSK